MKFSIKSDARRGNAVANSIRDKEVNHVQLDPRHRGCKKQIISIQIQKIESVILRQFSIRISKTCDPLDTSVRIVIPLTRNPVDPAGGYRYWSSIKPCESRVLGTRHTAQ